MGRKKPQKNPLGVKPTGKPRGKPFEPGNYHPGPGRKKMTKAAKRAAEETRNQLKLRSPYYLRQAEKIAQKLVKIGALEPAFEGYLELLNRAGLVTVKTVELGGGEKPIAFDDKKTIEVKIEATPERAASVLGIMARAGALTPGPASGGADDIVDAEVDEVHSPTADAPAAGVPSA